MKDSKSFKMVFTAILCSLAALTFMLENLFPPILVPGAKMGLSNIFVLFAALYLGGGYAFIVLTVKILIGSIFGTGFSALMYSLPSGVISLLVQVLLLKRDRTSIVAVSVLGAVINSAILNLVFCIVTQTYEYLSYLPYLSAISVFSGLIVGVSVCMIIKKFYRFILRREDTLTKEAKL